MHNVVFAFVREDHYVIEVYWERLESHTGKDELQASLKGGRVFPQTERQSKSTKGNSVCDGRRLVAVFLSDRHLSIPPAGVKRGVHGGVSNAIDAVVHAWDRVRFQDGNFL